MKRDGRVIVEEVAIEIVGEGGGEWVRGWCAIIGVLLVEE